RQRKRGLVLAVTDVPVRVGNLEEGELDRTEFGAEFQAVRTAGQRHVLHEVPDVIELFGGNPVVGSRLLVAVAECDLRKAAVIGVSGSRIITAHAELRK